MKFGTVKDARGSIFASGGHKRLSDDDVLLTVNENLILRFDDDGEELKPGDSVLVNHEVEAIIGEIEGKGALVGWPEDAIVHHLELISEPDPLTDWPDSP